MFTKMGFDLRGVSTEMLEENLLLFLGMKD